MATIKSQLFDRRFVLKGVGITIALPLMESLSGEESGSFSKGFQEVKKVSPVIAGGGSGTHISRDGIPKRLGFICTGYGCNDNLWFPTGNGKDYKLNKITSVLEPYKEDISFLQGLGIGGRPKNPHAGTYSFLVGETTNTTSSSVDMAAAEVIGKDTRFDNIAVGRIGRADGHGSLPSLLAGGAKAGAYKDGDVLYGKLFGNGKSATQVTSQLKLEKSSLDAVLDDIKRLSRKVGKEDLARMQEYFDSIRNIERRLVKAQQYTTRPLPEAPFAQAEIRKLKQKAVYDMLVVAMQTDSSRILTYTLATADVIAKHPHRISHKASGPEHTTRDTAFISNFAYFLQKLKNTREGDGRSLLDHSLIAYGTTIRRGHNFGSPPFILAGHAGGGIETGMNIKVKKGTETKNVWCGMLRHLGVQSKSIKEMNLG